LSFSHSLTFRTGALAGALVCAGLLGSARPAAAQARAAASASTPAADHFNEARALFERGETASACRMFERSYAEDPAPGTLYNMAVCHEREGRIADAYRQYDELASRAEAAGRADKAVGIRQRANALQPKLARVDLIHRADAVAGVTGVSIDGTVFLADLVKRPVYLAPGKHVIAIQHANGVTVTRTTEALAAGASQRVEMEDPAPEPEPEAPREVRIVRQELVVNHTRRIASYATGGAGVALLAAGAVLGVLALHEKSAYQSLCEANQCPKPTDIQTAYDDRSTARIDANLSTVGLIAGGVAVATAVYLFVSSRESASATSADLQVEPLTDGHGAGAQLRLRF
jgi:tetratricopeptide (TPR) repeat protein